jgi:molybdenum cofactor cytidylyltransferase
MQDVSKAFTRLGGILLAAGNSQRFHGDKQLACFRGQSLLLRSATALKESGANPIVAVIRPGMQSHQELLEREDVAFVINEHAFEGIASSLRAGLVYHENSGLEAVLVTTCDQPLVTGTHLRDLVRFWNKSRTEAAAAAYSGTVGIPAIFRSTLFAQLLELRGDRGAGQLLRRLPDLSRFDMPEAAFDIDTPEKLNELEIGG